MPWDGTTLRVRDLLSGDETVVAGGASESVSEPCWQQDGSLTFISDRDGWWNLYRWSPDDEIVQSLVEVDADIGVPQWMLGCRATRCWPMVEWYSRAGGAGSMGSRSACQMALSPTSSFRSR